MKYKNYIIIGIVCLSLIIGLFLLKDTDKPETPIVDNDVYIYFTDVSLKMEIGETYQTNLIIENQNNLDGQIEYSSDNENVAVIDNNGLVIAMGYGTTLVKVSIDSQVMSNIEISVPEKEEEISILIPEVPIEKVDIIEDEINVISSQKYQLDTNIYPNNATNKNLTYETNDSRIAEVTDKGLVVGRASGTTTINVYSNNEKTDSVTVNVSAPIISLDSIELMPVDVTLNINDSYQFNPILIPNNVTDSKVTWTSSDSSIASVSTNGLVTAKKVGAVTITATSNGKTAKSYVTVENNKLSVIVTKIIFDKENIVLEAGKTSQINATIMPSNATNKGLIWSSSNSSIATVSSNGVVKGISKGTAVITAKSVNGITNTISVTVNNSTSGSNSGTTTGTNPNSPLLPTEIILSSSDFSLIKKNTKQLKATILPLNASNQNVTWISSDESVATVSSTGLVTALKIGDATIAAMTSNGVVANTKVVVTAKPVTPETSATYYGNGNLDENTIAIINEHLYDFLEEAAYRARKSGNVSERRAKAMAAAYFLIYNPYYKVPYGFGGLSKYNYQGWNPVWSNTKGVECQGFVTWSLIQAGLPLGLEIQDYSARIEQIDANSYWTVEYILSMPNLKIGDVLNRRYPRDENGNKIGNGHWALIMDLDKENCTLTVAHATSVTTGLHLTTYKCGETIYYNRAFSTDKY